VVQQQHRHRQGQQHGLVTAVAAGSATITATSETKSGTAAITVMTGPVASVTVSPATATVRRHRYAAALGRPKDSAVDLDRPRRDWGAATPDPTVSAKRPGYWCRVGSVTITATKRRQEWAAPR